MAQASGANGKSEEAAESSRAEQSVQAFREALEKSVTISRDRLQEVIDDAVRRGRMTRTDADEIVGRLVTRGRDQADDLLGQLERLLAQAREAPGLARQQAGARAQKARKRAVKAVDKPLAGSPSSPGLSCAGSANTRGATRPARACCGPSTVSSRARPSS